MLYNYPKSSCVNRIRYGYKRAGKTRCPKSYIGIDIMRCVAVSCCFSIFFSLLPFLFLFSISFFCFYDLDI